MSALLCPAASYNSQIPSRPALGHALKSAFLKYRGLAVVSNSSRGSQNKANGFCKNLMIWDIGVLGDKAGRELDFSSLL